MTGVYDPGSYGQWTNSTTATPAQWARNSAALSAAIGAAFRDGGGTVTPGPGEYQLDATAPLRTGVRVVGQGEDATTLRWMVRGVDGMTLTGPSPRYVSIRDLKLRGTGRDGGHATALTFAPTSGGISGINCSDLRISGWGGDGVAAATIFESTFQKVRAETIGGSAFRMTGCTSTSLLSCYANDATGDGFNFSGCFYSSASACASDTCGRSYVVTGLSRGVGLHNCGSEMPVGDAFTVAGRSREATLVGCVSLNNNAVAFLVTGRSSAVMLGCRENSATVNATASFRLDEGSDATILGVGYITPPAPTQLLSRPWGVSDGL